MKKIYNRIRRYWKSGVSYGLGLRRSLAGPITVHIETTNICNFRCVYCPQSNPEDHFSILGRGKMSFADYKVILDKVTGTWPLEEVILTRDGEPLVHPQLDLFIAYASQKGLNVTIGSNGSYFNADRVEKLIEGGLTKVKGDFCFDKNKYESLRKGGTWEDVLEGYRNLVKYAMNNRKNFQLILIDLNSYKLKEEDIENSLQNLKDLFPYPEKYLSINPAVMHNAFNEAQTILSSSDKLSKGVYNRCHHPWIELIIDYKGNAVGCCRDLRSEYILGNVLQSEKITRDIWNGEKMQILRQKLANKSPEDISICSKCDLPYGISYAGRGILNKYIRFLQR